MTLSNADRVRRYRVRQAVLAKGAEQSCEDVTGSYIVLRTPTGRLSLFDADTGDYVGSAVKVS